MARQSTSSTSAPSSNGQPPPPTTSTSTAPPKPTTDGYDFGFTEPRYLARNIPTPSDASLLPTGNRSLSSISLQAFWLGFTLALSILSTTYLTFHSTPPYPLWRLPAFFVCLSLFHFLEFYTTARYNLPATRASSFLLFSHGRAYNTAHCLATLEILLSNFLFPRYQDSLVHPYTIALGLILVVIGQTVRSVAMAQAGTNFNHMPVQTRKEDHVLVTRGVYNYSRHPSYFGFFWWALGTQLLVGNKVCVVGYAGALWWFFYQRIIGKFVSMRSLCCGSVRVLTIGLQRRRGSLLSFSGGSMRSFGDGRPRGFRSSGSKTCISVVSSRPILHLLAPC